MNEIKIVTAMKNGDKAAIEYLITKYSKLMWSIASPILRNVASQQDVEECVADVFIYLWQHPEKYDAERGELKTWLSVLARTKAIDRYRELSKRNFISLDDTVFVDQIGVIDGILAEESKRTLIAAVQALDEPDREILVRRYYYKQKPKEISIALAMPVKHVENHLYRTKRKLREMVAV